MGAKKKKDRSPVLKPTIEKKPSRGRLKGGLPTQQGNARR